MTDLLSTQPQTPELTSVKPVPQKSFFDKVSDRVNAGVENMGAMAKAVDVVQDLMISMSFGPSIGRHVSDGKYAARDTVVKAAEGTIIFAAGTARTAYDVGLGRPAKLAENTIEMIVGKDIEKPKIIPDTKRGFDTLDSAAKVVSTVAEDPMIVVDAVVDPVMKDWNAGNYGAAIGRGTTEGVLILGGTGALGKSVVTGTQNVAARFKKPDVTKNYPDIPISKELAKYVDENGFISSKDFKKLTPELQQEFSLFNGNKLAAMSPDERRSLTLNDLSGLKAEDITAPQAKTPMGPPIDKNASNSDLFLGKAQLPDDTYFPGLGTTIVKEADLGKKLGSGGDKVAYTYGDDKIILMTKEVVRPDDPLATSAEFLGVSKHEELMLFHAEQLGIPVLKNGKPAAVYIDDKPYAGFIKPKFDTDGRKIIDDVMDNDDYASAKTHLNKETLNQLYDIREKLDRSWHEFSDLQFVIKTSDDKSIVKAIDPLYVNFTNLEAKKPRALARVDGETAGEYRTATAYKEYDHSVRLGEAEEASIYIKEMPSGNKVKNDDIELLIDINETVLGIKKSAASTGEKTP